MRCALSLALLLLVACGDKADTTDNALGDDTVASGGDAVTPRVDDASATFISAVTAFSPGDGAGWGSDHFPDNIMGPPHGAGARQGTADPAQILSLGAGGSITLDFGAGGIIDGDGVDFVIFENAFNASTNGGQVFYELAFVEVSDDAETWARFDCDVAGEMPFTGCAGVAPVLTNPDNGIAPDDLENAGGDRFDLADVDRASARFIRIIDAAVRNGPQGASGNAGFDLDAIAVLHSGS